MHEQEVSPQRAASQDVAAAPAPPRTLAREAARRTEGGASSPAQDAGGSAAAPAPEAATAPAPTPGGGLDRPEETLRALLDPDPAKQAEQVAAYGTPAQLHALTDAVITTSADVELVKSAFSLHWDVTLDSQVVQADTDGDGVMEDVQASWDVDTLRRVHVALKELPEADVRGSVWSKLTLEYGNGGGWMSHDGVFGLGADAAGAGNGAYGQGNWVDPAASQGDTSFSTWQGPSFAPDSEIVVGFGSPNAETVKVASVNAETKTITLTEPLKQDHAQYEKVSATGLNAVRDVDWLSAVVRHEIGHALDTALGGVQDFKQGLGGWWSGGDIDTWGAQMGDPWKGAAAVSDEEKTAIKDHITAFAATSGGKPLNDGLDPDHAINKHWGNNLPILEAAKAIAPFGREFWQNPGAVKSYNGYYFAVNHYYGNFQYYKAEVHENPVRNYAIFSPAEFFAEVYTVYYEEVGANPDAVPGRLVPVASWREWMTQNIHNRGLAPDQAAQGGATTPGVGMKAGRGD